MAEGEDGWRSVRNMLLDRFSKLLLQGNAPCYAPACMSLRNMLRITLCLLPALAPLVALQSGMPVPWAPTASFSSGLAAPASTTSSGKPFGACHQRCGESDVGFGCSPGCLKAGSQVACHRLVSRLPLFRACRSGDMLTGSAWSWAAIPIIFVALVALRTGSYALFNVTAFRWLKEGEPPRCTLHASTTRLNRSVIQCSCRLLVTCCCQLLAIIGHLEVRVLALLKCCWARPRAVQCCRGPRSCLLAGPACGARSP